MVAIRAIVAIGAIGKIVVVAIVATGVTVVIPRSEKKTPSHGLEDKPLAVLTNNNEMIF